MIYEKTAQEIANLLRKKQEDYGEYNIEKFGTKGILVRLNDKVSRLINLIWDSDKEPNFESVEDTWMDIAGYAILGIIEEQKELQKRQEAERQAQ